MNTDLLSQAADLLRHAHRGLAFTGAGISVESGIPPFRGPSGLWSKVDPAILDINLFTSNPLESWTVIKEIFYDFFGQAQPNDAHRAVASMQRHSVIQNIITQNIDNLHQQGGSPPASVIEYHGTSQRLSCTACHTHVDVSPALLSHLPPSCPSCGNVLKPDFVFFGEPIPPQAQARSLAETNTADVWIVVGTTGEIFPASDLPRIAKARSASIIEVNIQPSRYTSTITDVFLQGKATEVLSSLARLVGCSS